MPQSRWTPSESLLAERRIIPYSTEIHWRNQNYSYEFGCQAREAHWWSFEHWWLSKLLWSLDRFHTICLVGKKKFLTDILGPGRDWRENSLHPARSSVARTLEVNGKARQAEGKAKMVWRKDSSWKRTKIAWNLFHRHWGYGIQGNHQERAVRSWKHQWLLPRLVELWRIVGVVHPTKLRQNLRVF